MSVTRSTVALVRRLRRDIGHAADTVDRHLARQWVTAWDRIAPTMRAACTELAGIAVANDKWPSVHQIARSTALDAVEAARTELDVLAADTATVASAAAARIVDRQSVAQGRRHDH